jgi:hypothetical protein
VDQPPHRAITGRHPALAQFRHQRPQRQIRRFRKPGQEPIAFGGQRRPSATAHRLGRGTAGGAMPLRPLHHARNANPENLRNPAAALPSRNRRYNTLPKIKRISSRHPYWPPSPASILNQKSRLLGIPLRFSPNESDSSQGLWPDWGKFSETLKLAAASMIFALPRVKPLVTLIAATRVTLVSR